MSRVLCRVCATPLKWNEELGAWVHEASGRAVRGNADGTTAHRATPG